MSKDNMTEQEMWFKDMDHRVLPLTAYPRSRFDIGHYVPLETLYQMFKQRMQEEAAQEKPE